MMTVVPMPDPSSRPVPGERPSPPERPTTGEPAGEARARKKKDKVRSAWISFAGRIVAQVTGAIASVTLALLVMQKGQHAPAAARAESAVAPHAAAAAASNVEVVGGSPHRPTVAVLPIENFSGDPAQDAFANGMTEALTADLAQIDGLAVISRTSAMQYHGTRKPLPEIARELGATHLIEGSLVRDKAHVRVTAQLIDAASDRHVWARSYDRSVRDVLGVQAEMADAIAREIGATIAEAGSR